MKQLLVFVVAGLMLAACIPLVGTYMSSSQAAILSEYCAQHAVSTPHVGPVAGTNNARYIWSQLRANGFTPEAVAGILGNLEQESQLDPTAVQSNGVGHGIAQWSAGGRWDSGSQNLVSYAASQGLDKWDLQAQLGFLLLEMTNGWGGLPPIVEQYRGITDVMEATVYFHDEFERSADDPADVRSVRGGNAQEWFDRLAGDDPKTNTPTPQVSLQQPVMIVGDSITVGAKPHLEALFTKHDVKATIDAAQARTTKQALDGFATKQAKRALTWVVATGTNDYDPKAFAEHAATLINAARGRDVYWVSIMRPDKAKAINAVIEGLAAEHSNVHVLDVAAHASEHKDAFAADGVHMKNQNAYRWIAGVYEATLLTPAAASDPTAATPVNMSPEDIEACAELGTSIGSVPLGSCDNYPAKLRANFARTGFSYDAMTSDAQLVIACVHGAFPGAFNPTTYAGHWGGFGRSIDFMVPGGCSYLHTNKAEDLANGTKLTQFLSEHREELGVMYWVWQDHIRSPGYRSYEKQWVPVSQWRTDTGNNGDCTNQHFDHVHVSVYGSQATGMKTTTPTPTKKAPKDKKEKAA